MFTYRGHRINKTPGKIEWISDNSLTNAGGFLAILVALIPTSFGPDYASTCVHPLCHNYKFFGFIHLASAAGFLGIMGGMAIFKFTISPDEKKDWRHSLYKTAGYIVWISILLMAGYIFLKSQGIVLFDHGIFWGETIALIAFGTAWLVKGKVSEMWILHRFKKTGSDQKG